MTNYTILQGRLTGDPELRKAKSGVSVCSFTVAWSEKYGDTERELFLPCVAWQTSAETVARYFTKGSEIVVEGRLYTRKWQDNLGNRRSVVELNVERVHFCGPKRECGPASSIAKGESVDAADAVESLGAFPGDSGELPV